MFAYDQIARNQTFIRDESHPGMPCSLPIQL
jgi:hypothetical protein